MANTIASHVHTISVHTSDVNWVAFSGNSLATCSSDKTVRLWSLDDFAEQPSSPLCGHTYSVHNCMFSPSGATLATCSTDGKLILWDPKSGDKLAVLGHDSCSSIRVCRFSRDSLMLVTGGDDCTICIWDVKERKLLKKLEGHEDSVTAVAFSPDSALIISGSTNGDLRLWDGKFGHGKPLLFELDGHDLGVTCCEFNPTYGSAGVNVQVAAPVQIHFMLATCGFDNCIRLWDILATAGSPTVQLKVRDTLAGHGGHVTSCCFSPDGKLLASGAGDKTVRLWDPFRGVCLHSFEGHSRYVTSCAFSNDGKYLASGSNDRTAKIWKICTPKDLKGETGMADLIDLSVPPARKPLQQWSVDEVCDWLIELGLPQYVDNFRRNAIDGIELATLNQRTLEAAIGIEPLGHRNKVLRAIQSIEQHPVIHRHDSTEGDGGKKPKIPADSSVPDEYLCPITREIMKEPVMASDGYTYERAAIASWISSGKTRSPMTNAVLANNSLVPNRSLKMLIQRYLVAK